MRRLKSVTGRAMASAKRHLISCRAARARYDETRARGTNAKETHDSTSLPPLRLQVEGGTRLKDMRALRSAHNAIHDRGRGSILSAPRAEHDPQRGGRHAMLKAGAPWSQEQ